jgi:hypothetical protein
LDGPTLAGDSGCTSLAISQRSDCVFYEQVETKPLSLGTHPGRLQWGLRTGSYDHRRRAPEILVSVALTVDSVAIFHFRDCSLEDIPLAVLIATSAQMKAYR